MGADGITLDLGGHRIFGFPGPSDGTQAGVLIHNHSGATVRRQHRPRRRFESELGDGIVVFDSPGNRIAHNTLDHNGIFDGIGILGDTSDDNVIEHNVVEDTVGPSDGGAAGQGIFISSFTGDFDAQVINRVSDNVVRRSGSAGITNFNNVQGKVLRNRVEDNGFTNSQGNGIGVQLGFGAFDEGISTRMLVKGNTVNGNAWDGIQVANRAKNNRITDNDTTGNGSEFPAFFKDLRDQNPSCDNNTWFGNTWGTGGFNPVCVTTGGSGPVAAAAAAEAAEGATPPSGDPRDTLPIPRRRG